MSKQNLKSIKIAFWVLCCGAVLSVAQAQESLFVATVQRVILEPRGGQYCPDLCAASGRINSDGSTYVCISNDGGCDHTEYVVSRVLYGDMQLGANRFDARIGEWGGTHFPISNQPILVHMKPRAIEWVPIIVHNGQQRAQVKEFRHGILDRGIDVRALAQDGEDSVTLDSLVERLSTKSAIRIISPKPTTSAHFIETSQ